MRIGSLYGAGAAMGFTPQQVDEMSLWQFMAAAEGYQKANSPEPENALSTGDQDRLWAMVQAKIG